MPQTEVLSSERDLCLAQSGGPCVVCVGYHSPWLLVSSHLTTSPRVCCTAAKQNRFDWPQCSMSTGHMQNVSACPKSLLPLKSMSQRLEEVRPLPRLCDRLRLHSSSHTGQGPLIVSASKPAKTPAAARGPNCEKLQLPIPGFTKLRCSPFPHGIPNRHRRCSICHRRF